MDLWQSKPSVLVTAAFTINTEVTGHILTEQTVTKHLVDSKAKLCRLQKHRSDTGSDWDIPD